LIVPGSWATNPFATVVATSFCTLFPEMIDNSRTVRTAVIRPVTGSERLATPTPDQNVNGVRMEKFYFIARLNFI
jgi:hypothetical protein